MIVANWRAGRSVAMALVVLTLAVPVGAQSPAAAAQPGPASGQVRTLTIDEAVRLALENNLGLQLQRIDPLVQDENVREARTAWTPILEGLFNYNNADQPPESILSGSEGVLQTDVLTGNVGVSQLLPWWGTSYFVGWDNNRLETNNVFTNFNPRIRSGFALSVVQPLLRDASIDASRVQYLVSQKNREISDEQLRATVVNTVRATKNAYWELAYAVANLQAQRQSLELAKQTLKDNQTRVRVGTMAPIDIVEAEAEVARNEENVIVAEAGITRAEDQLRFIIFDPKRENVWQMSLEPTGYQAELQTPQTVDGATALTNALEKRTDLVESRKQLENVDFNLKYYRNQTLPTVTAQLDLSGAGVGGTEIIRGEGFPGPIIGTADKGFGEIQSDVFSYKYPTWAIGVSFSYPLGTSAAEASLTRAKLQRQQVETQQRTLEFQIGTEVREYARQVNTNVKRIEATRAARVLSERRLEAEQKKFGVGMSTSFLVFQAQRDLSTARNNELRALVDYAQSRVDFEAVQEAPLGGGGTAFVGGTGTALSTTFGTQTATAARQAATSQQR